MPVRAALLMLLAAATAGAESWTRVRAPHLDVVTDAAPEVAREAARSLERFRAVLLPLLPQAPPAEDLPTVVLLVQSERVFGTLRPRFQGRSVEAAGFYQSGTNRRFMVVRLDPKTPPRETLSHEYTHLLLNQALAVQPPWLGEGLAELLSDWEVDDEAVHLGRARLAHVQKLRRSPLLPLATLLAAASDSTLYNEGGERRVFYAQSWALVHWLLCSRPADGQARLAAYLGAVAGGSAPAAAWRSAFGEDLAAGEAHLRAWIEAGAPGELTRPLPPEAATGLAEASLAPAEAEELLGDALLNQERAAEAARHFERALEADPAHAPAHERLAQIALGAGKAAEAQEHLAAALLQAPDDPLVLHRYAAHALRAPDGADGVPSDQAVARAVAALERAVRAAPYFAPAVQLLAQLSPHPRTLRIAQVEAALARNPDDVDLAITLAGLHLDVRDLGRAREVLRVARGRARKDHHVFLCEHLLGRLKQAAAGEEEVAGRLEQLECRGERLSFVVHTAKERLRLHASSPVAVLLLGADGEPHERTLTCGPQSFAVRARFRREALSEGTILALTFTDPAR